MSVSQKRSEIKHIDVDMHLIGKEFPDIGVRFCPTYGTDISYPTEEDKKWLQIVHDGSNHWALASSGFMDNKVI